MSNSLNQFFVHPNNINSIKEAFNHKDGKDIYGFDLVTKGKGNDSCYHVQFPYVPPEQ